MKLITCVPVCVCMCACVCLVCVSASTIWKRVMTLQNLWYFLDVRRRWQGKVSDGKRNAQCSHIHFLSFTLSVYLPPSLLRSLSHSDYISLQHHQGRPWSVGVASCSLSHHRHLTFISHPSPSVAPHALTTSCTSPAACSSETAVHSTLIGSSFSSLSSSWPAASICNQGACFDALPDQLILYTSNWIIVSAIKQRTTDN